MSSIRRDNLEPKQVIGLSCAPISSPMLRVGSEIFWVTLGQALAILGAIAGVRLLTSLLTPDVYGELALGMTLATLVNQTVTGPIANAASRFFSPACEQNELQGFVGALRRLLVKGSGVTAVLGGGILLVLAMTGQLEWLRLGVAALCFALLAGYNSALDGVQNAARHRPTVAWHQASSSWGRFLIAAGMVAWFSATSAAAMFGYVLATLLVLISQMLFFHRAFETSVKNSVAGTPSRKWDSQMFSYAWPFSAWGILTWAQMVSDRWGLQFFGATREVGLYATLYFVGYYPVSIAADLVVQCAAPLLYQRAGDASGADRMRQVFAINKSMVYVALGLTGVAFAATAATHDLIFRVVAAPEYAPVSYLLPWMIVAGGLFSAGQTASLILMSSLETRLLLLPKIGTAILGVCLNFVGAALFGIPGVVAANILFSVAYLAWVLAIARRRVLFCGVRGN